MNQLSIFKNCVYLFMKLESYEFRLISLCWENLFIYEKDLLNDVLKQCYKIKHVICYSNLHQMFSDFM
jgi:hypothetical protein